MAEFKHLVLVKFKDDVVVDDVLKGLEKLASEMDTIKSFVWLVWIYIVNLIFIAYIYIYI